MVGSVISNEDHSSLNKNHWYFISIVVLKYFIGHMTKWNHKVHFCEWGFQPDLRSPEEKVLSSSLRARTATSKRLPGKPGCCFQPREAEGENEEWAHHREEQGGITPVFMDVKMVFMMWKSNQPEADPGEPQCTRNGDFRLGRDVLFGSKHAYIYMSKHGCFHVRTLVAVSAREWGAISWMWSLPKSILSP